METPKASQEILQIPIVQSIVMNRRAVMTYLLATASRTVGYLPLTVTLLVVLIAVRSRLHVALKTPKAEGHVPCPAPQSISSNIPFIGHLISYVKNGPSYFNMLCLSTDLPVFTINLATVKITLIQPKFTRYLPKVKHMSLNPLVLEMLRQSLGLGKFSSSLLKEEDHMSRQFGPHASRMFREEFIPNMRLRSYVKQIDKSIRLEIQQMPTQDVNVEDWVFKCLVGALGKSIWGGRKGPFHDQGFLSHLRAFLLNTRALNNPATLFVDKKLLESRRIVRERLEQFTFEEYSQRESDDFAQDEEGFLDRIRALCLRYEAPAEGWTDYQLLLIAGIGPNITSATTWLMYHVLDDPDRLRAVRDEIDEYVKSSNGSLDLADIPRECPLLHAIWTEVLRFHGTFTLGRYVHEDTILADDYPLQKGSYALAPLKPHHYSQEIWGEDAHTFDPRRFLKHGRFDEEARKKLRVFGLFGTICPGRFLAGNMAVALTIRLLSTFDVEPVNGKFVLPQERKDSVIGLATPDRDVLVNLVRRKGIDNVNIAWKS
ncbi:cytochrome P450 [Xylariales sp. AK1849]|nr:cytochrome P450 [Xylariales sp. AK1849]